MSQTLALPPATSMSSTQSSLSASAKVEPVSNKQPPPALPMSTDPNAQGQHATRLRGGCFVRHSSAVSILIAYKCRDVL